MAIALNDGPVISRRGFLDMQVCVPEDWDDEQVRKFLEHDSPCGTTSGWQIRKQGHERLSGFDERVPCAERPGYVHIMLEA